MRSSTRSRSSSPAFVPCMRRIAPLRPCSSPTSFHRRSGPPCSATMRGRGRWTITTPGRARGRASSWSQDQPDGRRHPRDLRRPRTGGAMRPSDLRGGAAAGNRGAGRTSHRRNRASRSDIGGIAVHIGQRVSALAGPSEVLVSSTVKTWWPVRVSRSPTVDFIAEGFSRRMASIRRRELTLYSVDHSVSEQMTSGLVDLFEGVCRHLGGGHGSPVRAMIRRPRHRVLRADG